MPLNGIRARLVVGFRRAHIGAQVVLGNGREMDKCCLGSGDVYKRQGVTCAKASPQASPTAATTSARCVSIPMSSTAAKAAAASGSANCCASRVGQLPESSVISCTASVAFKSSPSAVRGISSTVPVDVYKRQAVAYISLCFRNSFARF